MPNRIVRDGILFSVAISKLTPHAELLYRKLMSVVDDYGRFYAAPTAILISSCYPLQVGSVTSEEIECWLRELEQNDLLEIYTVEGKATLEIRKFNQRRRANTSKFPTNPNNCHTDDRHPPVNGQPSASPRSPEYEYEYEDEVENDKGKSSGKKKKAKGVHYLPEDWEPTEAHKETAASENVNLAKAAKLFRNWADGSGGSGRVKRSNWNLTFTNALMNESWMGRQAPLGKKAVVNASGEQLKRIKIQ